MDITPKTISEMQKQVDTCSAYIDTLSKGFWSPDKVNAILDAAMQQIELCCIHLRR